MVKINPNPSILTNPPRNHGLVRDFHVGYISPASPQEGCALGTAIRRGLGDRDRLVEQRVVGLSDGKSRCWILGKAISVLCMSLHPAFFCMSIVLDIEFYYHVLLIFAIKIIVRCCHYPSDVMGFLWFPVIWSQSPSIAINRKPLIDYFTSFRYCPALYVKSCPKYA